MSYTHWTPEQIAVLREFYPTHGAAYCANLLGRPQKATMGKAQSLGIKNLSTMRNGRAYVRKPAPAEPTLKIAPPGKGPAYLPGDPVTTAATRHVVYPTPPRALRTNTHSAY